MNRASSELGKQNRPKSPATNYKGAREFCTFKPQHACRHSSALPIIRDQEVVLMRINYLTATPHMKWGFGDVMMAAIPKAKAPRTGL
jgi:hypothetical protein